MPREAVLVLKPHVIRAWHLQRVGADAEADPIGTFLSRDAAELFAKANRIKITEVIR